MSDEEGETVGSAATGEEPPTETNGTDADSDTDGDGGPPLEEIADRIEQTDPEAIAEEIVTLREEIAGLKTDRDDFEARLKRKQAEFQNYKKRQEKQREKERARATEALVQELIEVRDNLKRALEQDESADIREGVEATFRQLDEVLDGEGVEPIEPDPGMPTDPKRHEVLLGVESDQPEGTVAEVHRPGYEMAEKVLRPAHVTVSEGSDDSGSENADGGSGEPGEENGNTSQDE
ncbi:MAG: nucleotide exchange factor GrpE [Natronomonas sp.]